jgi:hypothetical protein
MYTPCINFSIEAMDVIFAIGGYDGVAASNIMTTNQMNGLKQAI